MFFEALNKISFNSLFITRFFQILLFLIFIYSILRVITLNISYKERFRIIISSIIFIFPVWIMISMQESILQVQDYKILCSNIIILIFILMHMNHTFSNYSVSEKPMENNQIVAQTLRKGVAYYFSFLFFNLILSIPICYLNCKINIGYYLLFFFSPVVFMLPSAISEICIQTSLAVTNVIQNGVSAGFNVCIFGSYLISILFCIIFCLVPDLSVTPFALVLFSGAAVVYQITGGIFTKGADIGADLAGKIQLGLKEDDSKNPASIADNMGDLVGDCLGIFFNALALLALAQIYDPTLQIYPLLILGVIASGISYAILALFNSRSMCIYLILTLTMYYIAIYDAEAQLINLLDVLIVLTFFMLPKLFTSKFIGRYIAETAKNGAGLAITEGMGVTFIFTALLIFCMYQYSYIAFIYPMIFLIPSIISLNAIGAIADIAGGIVEMSGMPYRKETDEIDLDGNTIKASVKSMLGLFGIVIILHNYLLDIPSMHFVLKALIKALVFAFGINGFLTCCSKFAGEIVLKNVQLYLIENPEVLTGAQKADATSVIIRLSIFANLMTLILVLFILFISLDTLTSSIFGIISFMLGIYQIICGGLWDTTKKLIEDKKGTEQLNAAIQCDIVGDTYKDIAGPGMISVGILALANAAITIL